jgi:hypothetical protein
LTTSGALTRRPPLPIVGEGEEMSRLPSPTALGMEGPHGTEGRESSGLPGGMGGRGAGSEGIPGRYHAHRQGRS